MTNVEAFSMSSSSAHAGVWPFALSYLAVAIPVAMCAKIAVAKRWRRRPVLGSGQRSCQAIRGLVPALMPASRRLSLTASRTRTATILRVGTSEVSSRTPEQLRSNFERMGVLFAANHGVVTTPLTVATSLLSNEVASLGNGTLYAFTLLSSLLLGVPMVAGIGSKNSLLVGMLFYCIYAAAFAGSLAAVDSPDLQRTLFLSGSACGGLAAGVLWTAQGSYFSSTATALAARPKPSDAANTAAPGASEEGGREGAREAASAALAGNFASAYLLLEVGSRAAFSAFQASGMQVPMIAALYCAVGIASLTLMFNVDDFPVASVTTAARRDAADGAGPASKLFAAASLWGDPVLWLLAPTNITFGFCAAYMNGYVNGAFAAPELGKGSIGFLGALTAIVAALLSRGYGALGGGKGVAVAAGALSFFCIPLCTSILGCCSGWGFGLVLLYVLQGSGRAVYESTNRALFADFFPGSKAEGAFANCMLQSSLAFAICFFLQASLGGVDLGNFVIVFAVLTVPGYLLAQQLRNQSLHVEDEAGPAEEGGLVSVEAGAPSRE